MKIQYFIVFLVLFLSCEKRTKIPSDLYNRETMANIMEEVYILEFKVNDLKFAPDSLEVIYNVYEAKLFEENGYDSAKYGRSLAYYLDHPEHIEYIYSLVADSLSLRNRLQEFNK